MFKIGVYISDCLLSELIEYDRIDDAEEIQFSDLPDDLSVWSDYDEFCSLMFFAGDIPAPVFIAKKDGVPVSAAYAVLNFK